MTATKAQRAEYRRRCADTVNASQLERKNRIDAQPSDAVRESTQLSPADERFVTWDQLPDYGIPQYTRVHMRRMIMKGHMPPQVLLSPNRVAWRLSDLLAWKASRPTAPIPVLREKD
jgi:predicted DNA-binding transcriptional regulator AlpA